MYTKIGLWAALALTTSVSALYATPALNRSELGLAKQLAARTNINEDDAKRLVANKQADAFEVARKDKPELTPQAFLSASSSSSSSAEMDEMRKRLAEAEARAAAAAAAADPAMVKRIKDLEEMLAAERARKAAPGGEQMPAGVDQTDVQMRESMITDAKALYEKLAKGDFGQGDSVRYDKLIFDIGQLEDKLGLDVDARFVKSSRSEEAKAAEKAKKDTLAEAAKRNADKKARIAEDQASYAALMGAAPDAVKYPNAQMLKDLIATHVNKSITDLDRAAVEVQNKATYDEARALRYALEEFTRIGKYNTLIANVEHIIQGSVPAAAGAGASNSASDQGIFESLKVSDPAFSARLDGLNALTFPQKNALKEEVANWTTDQQRAFMFATRRGTGREISFESVRKIIEGILKGKPASSSSSSSSGGNPPPPPPPPAGGNPPPPPPPPAGGAGAGASGGQKPSMNVMALAKQGLNALGIEEPGSQLIMKVGKGNAWKAMLANNPAPTIDQMKTALQTDGLYK